ncbi:TPA: hypothetical protein DEA21_00350 [Candidatus Uhrbacteria bacterium]|nr:hypothetical protein [Candidatus Uhrbacteria bacterium]HCU32208.1 hypothetical protein [Candidatus Uhrbacteria bacterium]
MFDEHWLDIAAVGVLEHDPGTISRGWREEPVGLSLGQTFGTVVVGPPGAHVYSPTQHGLGSRVLSGVGQTVADRLAVVAEVVVVLALEVGVGHQPGLVAELVEILHETPLAPVLDGRQADRLDAIQEADLLLLAYLVVTGLRRTTHRQDEDEGDGEKNEGSTEVHHGCSCG